MARNLATRTILTLLNGVCLSVVCKCQNHLVMKCAMFSQTFDNSKKYPFSLKFIISIMFRFREWNATFVNVLASSISASLPSDYDGPVPVKWHKTGLLIII